jgi:hypothetical protein
MISFRSILILLFHSCLVPQSCLRYSSFPAKYICISHHPMHVTCLTHLFLLFIWPPNDTWWGVKIMKIIRVFTSSSPSSRYIRCFPEQPVLKHPQPALFLRGERQRSTLQIKLWIYIDYFQSFKFLAGNEKVKDSETNFISVEVVRVYVGVLISLRLFLFPIFLFAAQPKEFFFDGLMKL